MKKIVKFAINYQKYTVQLLFCHILRHFFKKYNIKKIFLGRLLFPTLENTDITYTKNMYYSIIAVTNKCFINQ